MKVKESENFCRVFILPKTLPNGFCFGGGHAVELRQVDWFEPCDPLDYLKGTVKNFNEYKPEIIKFLKDKNYYDKERCYIVLTRFGESFMLGKNII